MHHRNQERSKTTDGPRASVVCLKVSPIPHVHASQATSQSFFTSAAAAASQSFAVSALLLRLASVHENESFSFARFRVEE